jgi:hypothetical protein
MHTSHAHLPCPSTRPMHTSHARARVPCTPPMHTHARMLPPALPMQMLLGDAKDVCDKLKVKAHEVLGLQ